MATLNLQVNASADDTMEYVPTGITSWGLTSSQVSLGNWLSYGHVGLRFPSVSGLSGTTINSATLTFRAAHSDTGDFIGDWYAQDAEAPPQFDGSTWDVTDRVRTTATCEGNGAHFGDWAVAQDYEFTGDGVDTIADIIQELADSYDPSAIVLLYIWTSGTAERAVKSYDGASATAAKLDIDYTAAGPSTQTVYPDSLAVSPAFPEETVAPGGVTLTPAALALSPALPASTVAPSNALSPAALSLGPAFPAPTVVATATLTPATLSLAPAFPAPTVAPTATLTPPALSPSPAFPAPAVAPTVTLTPSALSVAPAFPAATSVGGGVTVVAAALAVSPTFPLPNVEVVSGPITVEATALSVTPAFPAPAVVPGSVTLTPSTLSVSPAFPAATVVPGSFTLGPTTLALSPAFPAPTVVVTQKPAALSLGPAFPTPTVAPTVTLAAAALTTPPVFATAKLVPGIAILTVSALALSVYFPVATVVGGVSTLLWKRWGLISWNLDPANYPSGAQWRVVAWVVTKSASDPVRAQLYDESHAEGVAVSQVSGTEEWPAGDEAIIPTVGPAFSLPSGEWRYSIYFGGIAGGEFICYGAVLEPV